MLEFYTNFNSSLQVTADPVHLNRGIPGIGLGLSYVKLITEAHMGTVSLSSAPRQGTIVRIEIPQP